MFSDSRAIGASTAEFGLFGGLLAIVFVNWSAFNGNQMLEQMRIVLILVVVLFIILNFSVT